MLTVPGNTGFGTVGVCVGGREVVLRVIVIGVSGFVGEHAPLTMVVVTAVRSAVTVTVAVPRTRLVAVRVTILVLVTVDVSMT